jgi:hypothetical protein
MKQMSEQDVQIDNLIDEIYDCAKSMHEQKEAAKNYSQSFLSVGIRGRLKNLKYAMDDLNKHLMEY